MKRLTTDEFIAKAKKIHGDKYDYSLVEYKNNKNKVKIICTVHGIFEQRASDHMVGYGCNVCGQEVKNENKRKYTNWLKKCNKKYLDKFDYSQVVYINNKTDVEITCAYHGKFKQTPSRHYKYGCGLCNKEKKLLVSCENFIKKCTITHNNKYDYSLVEYKGNKIKVKIICPIHGIFEQKPNAHFKHGCYMCNDSKGEKIICSYLDQYNIEYIRQHRFNDCRFKRPLPFDFYLPKMNMCIEFDGEQHFIPKKNWNGDLGFSSTKRNDKIKDTYCINNKIKLLRIKYTNFEKIEDILIKFLELSRLPTYN